MEAFPSRRCFFVSPYFYGQCREINRYMRIKMLWKAWSPAEKYKNTKPKRVSIKFGRNHICRVLYIFIHKRFIKSIPGRSFFFKFHRLGCTSKRFFLFLLCIVLVFGTADSKRRSVRPPGGVFEKLAILTSDTKAAAEKVTASGGTKKGTGGDVLFVGEVPGIGTKARNTRNTRINRRTYTPADGLVWTAKASSRLLY